MPDPRQTMWRLFYFNRKTLPIEIVGRTDEPAGREEKSGEQDDA